jgi:hypothetical protein
MHEFAWNRKRFANLKLWILIEYLRYRLTYLLVVALIQIFLVRIHIIEICEIQALRNLIWVLKLQFIRSWLPNMNIKDYMMVSWKVGFRASQNCLAKSWTWSKKRNNYFYIKIRIHCYELFHRFQRRSYQFLNYLIIHSYYVLEREIIGIVVSKNDSTNLSQEYPLTINYIHSTLISKFLFRSRSLDILLNVEHI